MTSTCRCGHSEAAHTKHDCSRVGCPCASFRRHEGSYLDVEPEPDIERTPIQWIKWYRDRYGTTLVESRDAHQREIQQLANNRRANRGAHNHHPLTRDVLSGIEAAVKRAMDEWLEEHDEVGQLLKRVAGGPERGNR